MQNASHSRYLRTAEHIEEQKMRRLAQCWRRERMNPQQEEREAIPGRA